MHEKLPNLNIDRLRTSEKRIGFLKVILPFVANSNNWDEVFDNLIEWRKPLVKSEKIEVKSKKREVKSKL